MINTVPRARVITKERKKLGGDAVYLDLKNELALFIFTIFHLPSTSGFCECDMNLWISRGFCNKSLFFLSPLLYVRTFYTLFTSSKAYTDRTTCTQNFYRIIRFYFIYFFMLFIVYYFFVFNALLVLSKSFQFRFWCLFIIFLTIVNIIIF